MYPTCLTHVHCPACAYIYMRILAYIVLSGCLAIQAHVS
nr:MAG TPA: hypothetical protein [Caudoviricetes sp.]